MEKSDKRIFPYLILSEGPRFPKESLSLSGDLRDITVRDFLRVLGLTDDELKDSKIYFGNKQVKLDEKLTWGLLDECSIENKGGYLLEIKIESKDINKSSGSGYRFYSILKQSL